MWGLHTKTHFKRLRQLPLLSLSTLQTRRELQRAHLVLSLIAHGYIVGMPKCDLPETLLPSSVAIPWFKVSTTLGLKPVVSYATLELANYKLLNPQAPPSLDNLAMLHTFSGSFDESWFYLIPLAIEAAGAPALKALLQARHDISNKVTETLVGHLAVIEKGLENMTDLLKRMYERNDPHIFWYRVRPYSGGSKNAKDLPNGLFFEGVTEVR